MTTLATLAQVLDEYEGVWQRAALEGLPQWPHHMAESTTSQCAASIGKWATGQRGAAATMSVTWRCGRCHQRCYRLSEVMVHLNDVHEWDWERFTTEFRNELEAGTQAYELDDRFDVKHDAYQNGPDL
jgi:hypothetical protein